MSVYVCVCVCVNVLCVLGFGCVRGCEGVWVSQ